MSMAVSLLMIAQAGAAATGANAAPVAEVATASVRVLRPAIVSFEKREVMLAKDAPQPQRNRDASGRDWIEFS